MDRLPGKQLSHWPLPNVQVVQDISPEATQKLREAGDLENLWGTAQFGLASVDVLMRIEALPGVPFAPRVRC